MTALRLGARGSPLARIQTAEAAAALADAGAETREVIIQSEGDRNRSTPLRSIGGRGVFVRAIEQALLDGRIDAAVHSAKDMPSAPLAGTHLAAYLPRADVRDAVVTRDGRPLAELPPGATVGTGSQRRAAQLRSRRPDLTPVDIRGNVDTRLRKLAAGEVDALLLAAAGLIRLGRAERAAELLPTGIMLPAPGQGALALQCRANDADARALLEACDDHPTHVAVSAERGVLAALGLGCSLPIAALARAHNDEVTVRARLLSLDGSRRTEAQHAGSAADAAEIGRQLGRTLLNRGGRDLLAELPK